MQSFVFNIEIFYLSPLQRYTLKFLEMILSHKLNYIIVKKNIINNDLKLVLSILIPTSSSRTDFILKMATTIHMMLDSALLKNLRQVVNSHKSL